MKRTPLKRKTKLQAKRSLQRTSIAVFSRIIETDPKIRLALSHRIAEVTKPKKKSATKHARRERAPEAWWLFVKTQPCFVAWLLRTLPWPWGKLRRTPCSSTIDADHMGDRMKQGDGTRALDSTCVSICHDHHMERHGLTGAFKDFTGEDMRVFAATGVQWLQNRARHAGVEIPNC
jgi:hypothetical protein